MEAHHTGNRKSAQRSKGHGVKVTRPINTLTDNEIGGNSRDAKVKVKAYYIK